jgi:hypothetical protein
MKSIYAGVEHDDSIHSGTRTNVVSPSSTSSSFALSAEEIQQDSHYLTVLHAQLRSAISHSTTSFFVNNQKSSGTISNSMESNECAKVNVNYPVGSSTSIAMNPQLLQHSSSMYNSHLPQSHKVQPDMAESVKIQHTTACVTSAGDDADDFIAFNDQPKNTGVIILSTKNSSRNKRKHILSNINKQ